MMSRVQVEVSQVIDAAPEAVYAVIADYHEGHPAILPKPYFNELTVEQGGRGAGTVVRFTMSVFGSSRSFRQEISEPEPGRVLVERDLDSDLMTTFMVEPLADGAQSQVTIRTDFAASRGITGFIQRLSNPPFLRHIYQRELRQLAAYVAGQLTSV